jgi:hypothetical protein
MNFASSFALTEASAEAMASETSGNPNDALASTPTSALPPSSRIFLTCGPGSIV